MFYNAYLYLFYDFFSQTAKYKHLTLKWSTLLWLFHFLIDISLHLNVLVSMPTHGNTAPLKTYGHPPIFKAAIWIFLALCSSLLWFLIELCVLRAFYLYINCLLLIITYHLYINSIFYVCVHMQIVLPQIRKYQLLSNLFTVLVLCT